MLRISPSSAAGQFLTSQGVSESVLESAKFRVLNWQAGDALTVVWPNRNATVFVRSRYIETDDAGELPISWKLALIRHELYHVEQGQQWGFFKYWARHLWARVKHRSISAKNSSVEAPAYVLQRQARAELDEMNR